MSHKSISVMLGAVLACQSVLVNAGELPQATVPEPGPIGLLALGGVALLVARRFKRNR